MKQILVTIIATMMLAAIPAHSELASKDSSKRKVGRPAHLAPDEVVDPSTRDQDIIADDSRTAEEVVVEVTEPEEQPHVNSLKHSKIPSEEQQEQRVYPEESAATDEPQQVYPEIIETSAEDSRDDVREEASVEEQPAPLPRSASFYPSKNKNVMKREKAIAWIRREKAIRKLLKRIDRKEHPRFAKNAVARPDRRSRMPASTNSRVTRMAYRK